MRTESMGLGAFIVACLLAISYVLAPCWWTFANFIAVASAVGTVAAAWVALWLGLKAQKAQQESAWSQCTLTAASLVADMEAPVSDLGHTSTMYGFGDLTEVGLITLDTTSDTELRELRRILEYGVWDIQPGELRYLTPLPNHAAQRLQHGARRLRNLRNRVTEAYVTWPGNSLQLRRALLDAWYSELGIAAKFIDTAFTEIKKAAALGAPTPSPEELYGSD